MISCYICGRPTDIRIDPRDKKPRPCGHCEEIIAEAVNDLDEDHVFAYTDTVDAETLPSSNNEEETS